MIDVLDAVVLDSGVEVARAEPVERTEQLGIATAPLGTTTASHEAPSGWYRRSQLSDSLQFWDGKAWRNCWLHPLPESAPNKVGPASAH